MAAASVPALGGDRRVAASVPSVPLTAPHLPAAVASGATAAASVPALGGSPPALRGFRGRGSSCRGGRDGLSRPVLHLRDAPVLLSLEACGSHAGSYARRAAHGNLRGPLTHVWHSHVLVPILLHCWHLFLCSLCSFLFFFLNLFRITVEEEIRHDLPWMIARDGSSQAEHFASKEPPHQTNGLWTLIVAWDGNIHVPHRGVSCSKSNDRDVDIRRLSDRLVVSARIRHNQKAGLTESSLDLVSEGTRSETSCNWCSPSGRCKLQHSPLTVGAS